MLNKVIITIKANKIYFLLFVVCFMFSCSNSSKGKQDNHIEWTNLIDENLTEWDTYLSFKHKVGYDGSVPTDSLGNKIEPIGMNNPNYNVFSTILENDEHIIKVSGEYYGCLVTKNEYENYHFQIKYKWGDKKWNPRMNRMKDSGILYHSIGPLGAEHWRSWMLSQEFQIMEAHTGDFWSQATSAIDIRAYKGESRLNPMADESQDFLNFGKGGAAGNYCLRSNNYEKKHDEWNTLDLVCFNGKSLHIVNGEVVMILKNSRYVNESGEVLSLVKGKIQLQSEAAELYFKDIKIRPIKKLSTEYSSYFD